MYSRQNIDLYLHRVSWLSEIWRTCEDDAVFRIHRGRIKTNWGGLSGSQFEPQLWVFPLYCALYAKQRQTVQYRILYVVSVNHSVQLKEAAHDELMKGSVTVGRHLRAMTGEIIPEQCTCECAMTEPIIWGNMSSVQHLCLIGEIGNDDKNTYAQVQKSANAQHTDQHHWCVGMFLKTSEDNRNQ